MLPRKRGIGAFGSISMQTESQSASQPTHDQDSNVSGVCVCVLLGGWVGGSSLVTSH